MVDLIVPLVVILISVGGPVIFTIWKQRQLNKLSPEAARRMTAINCQAPVKRCRHCGKSLSRIIGA